MANITRQFSVVHNQENDIGLKIAFASDDAKNVNQHFGSAKSIVVYTISPLTAEFLTIAEFSPPSNALEDDKLAVKLEFLEGCAAIYCRACGASAIKQLLELHIQPLKVVENVPIKTLIKSFQEELQEGPANWLAKAILRQRAGYKV